MKDLEKLIANAENPFTWNNLWAGVSFGEYMRRIAPVCNYNPLSMLSAQTGQCISEPVDALLDGDFRESAWKLLPVPLIPVAAALVALEIGVDLLTRPRTGLRKLKNIMDTMRYHAVPGPKKNFDILWSIEAEAVRRCPSAEDMFGLYSLTLTIRDDFKDYLSDPPGKNIFSLQWDDVQASFKEQKVTEKHERVFYGCPDCGKECVVHAFLDKALLEDPTNLYRRLWHTLQRDVKNPEEAVALPGQRAEGIYSPGA